MFQAADGAWKQKEQKKISTSRALKRAVWLEQIQIVEEKESRKVE